MEDHLSHRRAISAVQRLLVTCAAIALLSPGAAAQEAAATNELPPLAEMDESLPPMQPSFDSASKSLDAINLSAVEPLVVPTKPDEQLTQPGSIQPDTPDSEMIVAGSLRGPGSPGLAQVYRWRPSTLGHRPLYFEDVPLERYGQTRLAHLQPLVSGAKFYRDVVILPYRIGTDWHRPHIFTLGHFRPGSAAPCVGEWLPTSARGAALQAAATTGVVFLFP